MPSLRWAPHRAASDPCPKKPEEARRGLWARVRTAKRLSPRVRGGWGRGRERARGRPREPPSVGLMPQNLELPSGTVARQQPRLTVRSLALGRSAPVFAPPRPSRPFRAVSAGLAPPHSSCAPDASALSSHVKPSPPQLTGGLVKPSPPQLTGGLVKTSRPPTRRHLTPPQLTGG